MFSTELPYFLFRVFYFRSYLSVAEIRIVGWEGSAGAKAAAAPNRAQQKRIGKAFHQAFANPRRSVCVWQIAHLLQRKKLNFCPDIAKFQISIYFSRVQIRLLGISSLVREISSTRVLTEFAAVMGNLVSLPDVNVLRRYFQNISRNFKNIFKLLDWMEKR